MLITQESLAWLAIALSAVSFLFYVLWVKTVKRQPIALPDDTTPVARAERFILEHRKKQESQQAGVEVETLVWMRQVALACDILCIALSGFLFGWVISYEDATGSVLLAKASIQGYISMLLLLKALTAMYRRPTYHYTLQCHCAFLQMGFFALLLVEVYSSQGALELSIKLEGALALLIFFVQSALPAIDSQATIPLSASDFDQDDDDASSIASGSTAVEADSKPRDPIRGRYASLLSSWLNMSSDGFMFSHFRKVLSEADISDVPASIKPAHAAQAYRDHTAGMTSSTLWKMAWHFKLDIAWQALFSILTAFHSISKGLALEALLHYLADRDREGGPLLRKGVLLAIALGFFKSLSQPLEVARRRSSFAMAMKVKAILSFEIFSKVFRHSNSVDATIGAEGKENADEGHIQSLLTVNANYISVLAENITVVLFQAPLGFLFAGLALYRTTGQAIWGGIIVMIVNAYIGHRLLAASFRYYNEQQKLIDARLRLTTETITHMRWVKFSAYETIFGGRIRSLRKAELKVLRKRQIINTLQWAQNWSTVALVSSATLCAYTLLGKPITAPLLFSVFFYSFLLTGPVTWITSSLNDYVFALTGFRRIDAFLKEPDTEKYILSSPPSSSTDSLISTQDVSATWSSKSDFALQVGNLSFGKGLNVIFGPVGSGKTCLLQTLLGETMYSSGQLTATAPISLKFEDWLDIPRVAYCSQQAFIFSATFRENVLFGRAWDAEWYQTVLSLCCLEEDLRLWRYGDLTLVGERGQILSGGQKARLALARALYSRAELILLDDTLAAVDAETQRKLFNGILTGSFAKERTIILVTHAEWVAQAANQVLSVDRGRVQASPDRHRFTNKSPEVPTEDEKAPDALSQLSKEQEEDPLQQAEVSDKTQSALLDLRRYIADLGRWPILLLVVLSFIIAQLLNISVTYYLKWWSQQRMDSSSRARWLMLQYLALIALSIVVDISRLLFFAACGLQASEKLSNRLTQKMLSCEVGVFDRLPVGRWISRNSADLLTCDLDLPQTVSHAFIDLLFLCLAVFLCAYFVPAYIVFCVLYVLGIIIITLPYRNVAGRLKAFESASRSPLSSYIIEVIRGKTTFRAYGNLDYGFAKLGDMLENHILLAYHMRMTLQWYAVRLGLMAGVATLAICLYLVLSSADVAVAGFILVTSMDVYTRAYWFTAHVGNLQLHLNSIERILEYTYDLKQEKQGQAMPPSAWPSRTPALSVKDLTIRYAEHLPPVLKHVSFDVKATERVAIVGRTGAGKSTLTLALFRFLEAEEGQIRIDDVDIAGIDLQRLRAALNIVTQDPVLFKGTIRDNLDPAHLYSDQNIWRALKAVGLSTSEGTAGETGHRIGSLEDEVEDSGANLSAGQKQLVALGRALLRFETCPFLILDEATAMVDAQADATIQRVIRNEMKGATILCIAHRLTTIADYDRVLVMAEGRVAEFDTPAKLLANESSAFYQLAKSSGELEKLKELAGVSQ